MKAVVLAGGEGVRPGPLTYAVPMPLPPVGDKPVLEEVVATRVDTPRSRSIDWA